MNYEMSFGKQVSGLFSKFGLQMRYNFKMTNEAGSRWFSLILVGGLVDFAWVDKSLFNMR